MRENITPQLQLGEIDIHNIQFNPRSGDGIHQLLTGLKYLYINTDTREKIFTILEDLTPKNISTKRGAPGMTRWKIFVLGMLRLNINRDNDRLLDLANYHNLLRQMMRHTKFDEDIYALQTLKDNVSLFTTEILEK